MNRVIIAFALAAYSDACTSDRQCSPFHKCTMDGVCVEVAKLGANCTSRRECQLIDSWADCIDHTCQCSGDTVYHGYECVNPIPRLGKSDKARILLYTLIAVTSCLALGLGIAELVEKRRCAGSMSTGIEEDPPLVPIAGSSNSLNSSFGHHSDE